MATDPISGAEVQPKERRRELRRREDHFHFPLSTVAAMLLAICGGLALVYLFFAALGAVDFKDAAAASLGALVLAAVWFAGFFYRQRTSAARVQWKDRERRGF